MYICIYIHKHIQPYPIICKRSYVHHGLIYLLTAQEFIVHIDPFCRGGPLCMMNILTLTHEKIQRRIFEPIVHLCVVVSSSS